MQNIFNFLSLFLGGLLAGLFFSYSYSVNPGLKSLADNEYVKAMQSINIAIQNPYFFISFMGLLFVFPVSTYLMYRQQTDRSLPDGFGNAYIFCWSVWNYNILQCSIE
jgi:uncharacterized membrane protein